ncbi:MAG: LamG domain-containing protein [Kiritimatiellae bacterium]|jgi:hypothetical protein|nr:LamG domain-containing protein [Kiritimatiellia bacterium]
MKKRFYGVLFSSMFMMASAVATEPQLVAKFNATTDGGFIDSGPFHVTTELLEGAEIASDPIHGSVLSLNGNKAHVVCKPCESIDRLTYDFTVAAWVRLDHPPGGSTSPIITKRTGWWTGKPFSINARGDGLLEAVINDGKDQWMHGKPLPAGVWQHVALVVDETQAVLYQDGIAVAKAQHSGRLVANAEPISLGFEQGGDFPGGDFRAFPGQISDVVFLATPLSGIQVAQLRDGTLATRPVTTEELPRRGMPESLIPAGVNQPPSSTAPLEAYIQFTNATPDAVGMWFDPTGVRAGTFENKGQQEACWIAGQGSSVYPWERAIGFVFTDPRFRNGAMPAVDVEIEYALPAWAGVQVMADTSMGSRQVGGGWQATEWQTMRFRIDNAYFGRRDFGNPATARASDGYDLRLNASTSDLYIKSIRVRGYDRSQDPDFKRLLKLQSVDTPRDIFLYLAGEPVDMSYAFTNLALRPVTLSYRLNWERHDGTPIGSGGGEKVIAGGKGYSLPLQFDTKGEPCGVCVVKAVFEQKTKDGVMEPLFERTTYIGLTTPGKIAKAAPGEFLYGLDTGTGPAHQNSRVMRWCAALGVDIVRGGIDIGNLTFDDFERGMPIYANQGLQPLVMLDPPWVEGEAKRDAETDTRARFLEDAARRYPQVRYWELGNEPDLTFFYRGPIEAYAKSFETMARAIQRGNPAAVVMNGGLCFAGDDADRRARRFIEVVDPTAFGAWAYHGHGPNEKAERDAYERIHLEAARYGKAGKPFIETESGVSARERSQEIVQASTCVQKMTYAQSIGMPFFMWFRLVMTGEDYNSLIGDQEPRPVVLAYRNMVQQLRHHVFAGTIELQDDAGTGYRFRRADGHVVCVFWRKVAGSGEKRLRIATKTESVNNVRLIDLYGNVRELPVSDSGEVAVMFSPDPQFLVWQEKGDNAFKVAEALPLLAVPNFAWVATGVASPLSVTVRNPFNHPIKGRLTLAVDGERPISVSPVFRDVVLAPGDEVAESFDLMSDTSTPPIRWPETWRVFVDVDEAVKLAAYRKIPSVLPAAAGGNRYGLAVRPENQTVNIQTLGNTFREKAVAIAFAEVWSAEPCTVTMGASADWWMAWTVNGEPVYDTLASGNGGGYSVLDHVFPIQLRAGRNIVAVKVLSGSMGWKFLVGSPHVVSRLQAGRTASDVCQATFRIENGTTHTTEIPIQTVRMLDPLEVLPQADNFEAWMPIAPDAKLGATHVENFFVKQPDASRWWQGDKDLSSIVWVQTTETNLVLTVAVSDVNHESGDELHGDRIKWNIEGENLAPREIIQWINKSGVSSVAGNGKDLIKGEIQFAGRNEAKGLSIYQLRLSKLMLSHGVFRVNLEVYDKDGDLEKQVITWAPAETGNLWPHFLLP